MAQYFEDFEASTLGVQPTGWTKTRDAGTTTWTAEDVAGVGRVLRGNGSVAGTSTLTWDLIDADANRANIEIIARIRSVTFPGAGTNVCGLVARADNTTAIGYQAFMRSSDVLRVLQTATTVQSATLGAAFVANTWYRMLVRINGTTVQARVWLDTDPDPVTWQVDTTDGALSTGGAGVVLGQPNHNVEVDWIGVGTNGDAAPTSAPAGGVEMAMAGGGSASGSVALLREIAFAAAGGGSGAGEVALQVGAVASIIVAMPASLVAVGLDDLLARGAVLSAAEASADTSVENLRTDDVARVWRSPYTSESSCVIDIDASGVATPVVRGVGLASHNMDSFSIGVFGDGGYEISPGGSWRVRTTEEAGAIFRARPASISGLTNLTGVVASLQDDPEQPGTGLTATALNAGTSVTVNFPTASTLSPLSPTVHQRFRIAVRRVAVPEALNPSVTIRLRRSGTLLATLETALEVGNAPWVLLEYNWLADSTNPAGLQLEIVGTAAPGGLGATIEPLAAEWCVELGPATGVDLWDPGWRPVTLPASYRREDLVPLAELVYDEATAHVAQTIHVELKDVNAPDGNVELGRLLVGDACFWRIRKDQLEVTTEDRTVYRQASQAGDVPVPGPVRRIGIARVKPERLVSHLPKSMGFRFKASRGRGLVWRFGATITDTEFLRWVTFFGHLASASSVRSAGEPWADSDLTVREILRWGS